MDDSVDGVEDSNASGRRRHLAFEMAAIVCLAVLPDVAYSAMALRDAAGWSTYVIDESAMLLRSLQVAVPTLWIMARSGEDWATFGLRKPRFLPDLGLGILLWGLALVAMRSMWLLVPALAEDWGPGGQKGVLNGPLSAPRWALVALMEVANSFSEELVMRGYLIPRFEEMARSRTVAVVASALLWAGYHSYQGFPAMLDIALFGLIMGAFFVVTRRLWPLVVGHTIWNLVELAFSG